MTNYYFLAASLPTLELGSIPEITFHDLIRRFEINLTKEDLEKTIIIRRMIDLLNIRALLLEETIDLKGNLSEKELDEALLIHDGLPPYVFDFLSKYETLYERIRNFSELIAAFFTEEIARQKGFVKRYLNFEREWRLVMIGIRAKELGRDVVKELQFEDFSDPLVAHLLAQKDMPVYQPPEEYLELKELLHSCGSDPWERYKAFAAWRFRKVEELVEREPLFSIDWILAYMVRLLIIEDWNELDAQKGKMILDTFKVS
jgi:hypothetical protein